jgi:hypothetical protein
MVGAVNTRAGLPLVRFCLPNRVTSNKKPHPVRGRAGPRRLAGRSNDSRALIGLQHTNLPSWQLTRKRQPKPTHKKRPRRSTGGIRVNHPKANRVTHDPLVALLFAPYQPKTIPIGSSRTKSLKGPSQGGRVAADASARDVWAKRRCTLFADPPYQRKLRV